MTKTYFAFLDDLKRIAELKIEQLFNGIGIITLRCCLGGRFFQLFIVRRIRRIFTVLYRFKTW